MIAETTSLQSRTGSSTISEADRVIRPDVECQARAREFLSELVGSPSDDLPWDDTYHLRGHGHLHGHELIVIAPRDDDHHTVVLTAEDWDVVRQASTDQRRDLLENCAIADRDRLVAVLSDHRITPSFLTVALKNPGPPGTVRRRAEGVRHPAAMRELIVTENITVDGVIDAAGGWSPPAGTTTRISPRARRDPRATRSR